MHINAFHTVVRMRSHTQTNRRKKNDCVFIRGSKEEGWIFKSKTEAATTSTTAEKIRHNVASFEANISVGLFATSQQRWQQQHTCFACSPIRSKFCLVLTFFYISQCVLRFFPLPFLFYFIVIPYTSFSLVFIFYRKNFTSQSAHGTAAAAATNEMHTNASVCA